jgi:hypothetical protein
LPEPHESVTDAREGDFDFLGAQIGEFDTLQLMGKSKPQQPQGNWTFFGSLGAQGPLWEIAGFVRGRIPGDKAEYVIRNLGCAAAAPVRQTVMARNQTSTTHRMMARELLCEIRIPDYLLRPAV